MGATGPVHRAPVIVGETCFVLEVNGQAPLPLRAVLDLLPRHVYVDLAFVPTDATCPVGRNQHPLAEPPVAGVDHQKADFPGLIVDDFLVDDETWEVRFLVIDTSHWWFGKRVLIAPHWASRISWDESKVYVDMSRQKIKNSPEWNRSLAINLEYEARLADYYGRPVHRAGSARPEESLPVHSGRHRGEEEAK